MFPIYYVAVDPEGNVATSYEWRKSYTEFHYVAGNKALPPILMTSEAPKPTSGDWTMIPVTLAFSGLNPGSNLSNVP